MVVDALVLFLPLYLIDKTFGWDSESDLSSAQTGTNRTNIAAIHSRFRNRILLGILALVLLVCLCYEA